MFYVSAAATLLEQVGCMDLLLHGLLFLQGAAVPTRCCR
jgi:hypothetical protein